MENGNTEEVGIENFHVEDPFLKIITYDGHYFNTGSVVLNTIYYYKVTTNEVLANIRGVERTIEYFDKYNIELTKEELEILKLKMNKYQELLKNKERINPIDGRAYNLDDLYNIAVQDQTNKVDNLMERTGRKY